MRLLCLGNGFSKAWANVNEKIIELPRYNPFVICDTPIIQSKLSLAHGFLCLFMIFLIMTHDFLMLSLWEIMSSR